MSGALSTLFAVFLKEVRHRKRHPGQVLITLAIPYFFTLVLSGMGLFVAGDRAAYNFSQWTGTENFFVYQIIGATIWIMAWMITEDIGASIRKEQIGGTLEQSLLAPINRFHLLVGIAATHTLISMALFSGVIGVTAFSLTDSGALGLLQAFIVLSLGMVPLFGIGFLLSAFVLKFKDPYSLTHTVNMIFSVIAGTYYPIAILPSWVQLVSGAIPQTYLVEHMRQILLANRTLVELAGGIFVLILLGVLYPALGYLIFRRVERSSRVSGDLSKF